MPTLDNILQCMGNIGQNPQIIGEILVVPGQLVVWQGMIQDVPCQLRYKPD